MLHLDRASGCVDHRRVVDLPELLSPGDHLVFNDVRVIPARLWCRKSTGARIELLCTRRGERGTWRAMARPRRRLREGMVLAVDGGGDETVTIEGLLSGGEVLVGARDGAGNEMSMSTLLRRRGRMPLPHYIRREAEEADSSRYQTVYGRKGAAVAAPTAGLHFTDRLLRSLCDRGIRFSFVTLDVGMGTFRPVKTEDPRKHEMHVEHFEVSSETAREINRSRSAGRRIIAVGTTVVRGLEHCFSHSRELRPGAAETSLMILPGYEFKAVRGLITNFHLPRSTLLMLVCAFAGADTVLNAYRTAVDKRYRFYSYGDAMLIM